MVALPITAWMHDSRDVELSLIVDTSNCTWSAGNNLEGLMILRCEDARSGATGPWHEER